MTFISVESQRRVKTKIFLLFMTLVTVPWIVYLLHDKNYYYKLQRFKPEVLQTSIYKNDMLSKSAMCKKVELSSRPLTKTALASFPGSGNTWIRYLIQQSTGIATGSVYNDTDLLKSGFPGENIRNSSVIVIKTHSFGKKFRRRYNKCILIIRNPFDAILSEFNRIYGGHTGYAKDVNFKKGWEKFVSNKIDRWRNMYIDWLQFSGPLYLVVYEDLKLNLSSELSKLLKFLNVKITKNDMKCVVRNSKGKFKRNNTNHNKYTRTMREKINKIKQDVQNAIDRHWKIKKRIY